MRIMFLEIVADSVANLRVVVMIEDVLVEVVTKIGVLGLTLPNWLLLLCSAISVLSRWVIHVPVRLSLIYSIVHV